MRLHRIRSRSLPRHNGNLCSAAGGRTVQLAHDGQKVVDFVRCSYLGLDNHRDIVAGAAKAVEDSGTLHWSCARTRLNFSILGELEEDLSDLFRARVLTFTTVLAANMSALPPTSIGTPHGRAKTTCRVRSPRPCNTCLSQGHCCRRKPGGNDPA